MSKNTLIAVVDDEGSIRKAPRRLLRSAELEVASFSSGTAFFESISTRRRDCLVLGRHMPVMDGLKGQTRLAGTGSRIPVITITGQDSPEARWRAMAGHPAAYFRKPVDGQALLDANEFVLTLQPLKS